jgi:hypothetical protein
MSFFVQNRVSGQSESADAESIEGIMINASSGPTGVGIINNVVLRFYESSNEWNTYVLPEV